MDLGFDAGMHLFSSEQHSQCTITLDETSDFKNLLHME